MFQKKTLSFQRRKAMPPRMTRTGIAVLLTTTALSGLGSGAVFAQEVIDGGAETVNGGGGGTQPSPWNVGDDLIIGDTALGILNVSNGGDVTSDSGTIGNTATGNGSVGLSDPGTTWIVSGEIAVGEQGTGAMTVSSGSNVSSSSGIVGNAATATGTVQVTDAGSAWNLTSSLIVGWDGTGSVEISNGGVVSSAGGTIGRDSGSYGEVTVNGAGSAWTVSTFGLTVGSSGEGVLNIEDGGAVTVADDSFTVGTASSGEGTVNLTNGSTLDITGTTSARVGWSGDGTLNVTDSTVDAGSVTVAFGSNLTGTVTVSGNTAAWNGTDLTIGLSDTATGIFTAEDQATVTLTGGITLGSNPGANGTLTIDNATVSAGATLSAGSLGDGQVTVQNGGTLISGDGLDAATLGSGANGTGSATVTGVGSTWTANGNVEVGRQGAGTLSILDSAVAAVMGELLIGDEAGGTGTVTVDDATLSADVILVGNDGAGTMTISGGSTVTVDDFIVANAAGSSGTATVTGTGTSLDLAIELNVGLEGTGTLDVTNGGNILAADGVRVGTYADGVGTININGVNSEITNNANTRIGDDGTGTVALTNGAHFYADLGTFIGDAATATGTLTLDGSGTYWENGGDFFVGYSGSGSVSVTNGADIVGDYVSFGRNLGSSATVIVDGAGSTWTNTGDLYVGEQGTADLTISNGATVSNAVAYIGYDSDAVGTVTVDGAGSAWTNSSNVYVGEDGTGTLTIANGGTVSVGGPATLVLGNTSGSGGTLNIGAASGGTATAAGTLDAAFVEFGTGNGEIVFNHTDTSYDFDAIISGDGEVVVESGETVFNGAHTYTGPTTLSGGTLIVNGSIVSDVLGNEGRIGGTGSVGNLSVTNDTTLAPGNSVGTLSAGDVIFGSASLYEVELNDGGFVAGTNNDLLDASGVANLFGGWIHVLPENGTDDGSTYTYGTYTILTAAGGVSGTFDDVTDDYIFLDFTLSYDANNVYITSEEALFFTDLAQTPNQLATAGALQALGNGNAVYDAVVTLAGNDDAARAAYDALSGEIHASVQTSLVEGSRQLRDAANDRIRSAFDAGTSASIPLLAYGEDGLQPEMTGHDAGPSWWGSLFGAYGHTGSDGNAGAYDRAAGGFVAGIDGMVSDALRLGFLAGISRSALETNDRASSGSVNSYELGVYGGGMAGAVSWRFGGTVGWHDIDTARTPAFGAFSETLTAGYSAVGGQVFGEVSRSFERGAIRYEPYVNLAHVYLSTGSFAETGGAAALSGPGSTMDTTFTTLGLRGDSDVMLAGRQAKVTAGLGWQHAFGDVTPTYTERLRHRRRLCDRRCSGRR
jgi:outer membrane autotransporter protein